jgi:predicted component of type VI protein secretion system
MKDNFDLKKFLTENKTIEKSNPYLKEEMSDSEKEKVDREVDAVRDDLDQISKLAKDAGEDAEDIKSALRKKIREMIISELSEEPISPEEEEDFINPGNPEEEAKKRKKYLDDFGMPPHMTEAKKDEEETPEENVADEEVDAEEEVDVDVTDEETTDEEGDEMNVPEMEGDEGEILNHLMKALGMAKSTGDEKLIKQIGNTVTFLTRQYISGE